ncbi:hypothetical protein GE061_003386 [Apolygus lucorum]|uniref:C2H2-type domain-containing protein n=1 Tax=Apolygus lucorum TaxID=248454 RepID=A0A8S9X5Z1_APOLU|nr:hypothetical protein GE061_003386 [Apolygus lucorum]
MWSRSPIPVPSLPSSLEIEGKYEEARWIPSWSYIPMTSHACYKCQRIYRRKQALSRHLKYECGIEAQFHCPHCPHRSKLKENWRRHIALRHFHLNK